MDSKRFHRRDAEDAVNIFCKDCEINVSYEKVVIIQNNFERHARK